RERECGRSSCGPRSVVRPEPYGASPKEQEGGAPVARRVALLQILLRGSAPEEIDCGFDAQVSLPSPSRPTIFPSFRSRVALVPALLLIVPRPSARRHVLREAFAPDGFSAWPWLGSASLVLVFLRQSPVSGFPSASGAVPSGRIELAPERRYPQGPRIN